jgi:hypothetical protein
MVALRRSGGYIGYFPRAGGHPWLAVQFRALGVQFRALGVQFRALGVQFRALGAPNYARKSRATGRLQRQIRTFCMDRAHRVRGDTGMSVGGVTLCP